MKEDEEDEDDLAKVPKISMVDERLKDWRGWLSEGQFYIYGCVYMLVRIAVNVTMSVQPFYLLNVTGFEKSKENPTPLPIALTPLVSYITSLVFSLFFYKKMMAKAKNRFIPLFISIIIISLGSFPLLVSIVALITNLLFSF